MPKSHEFSLSKAHEEKAHGRLNILPHRTDEEKIVFAYPPMALRLTQAMLNPCNMASQPASYRASELNNNGYHSLSLYDLRFYPIRTKNMTTLTDGIPNIINFANTNN